MSAELFIVKYNLRRKYNVFVSVVGIYIIHIPQYKWQTQTLGLYTRHSKMFTAHWHLPLCHLRKQQKKAKELTCRARRIYKVFQIFNFFMDSDPNKCEFCYAFFADASKEAEHNRKCEFRLSRTFLAIDGKVKFACTVSGGATIFSFFFLVKKLIWIRLNCRCAVMFLSLTQN